MQINRNLKTLNNKTGSQIKSKLSTIISTHEAMRNCYFWTPPQNASGRRSYENYKSNYIKFKLDGKEYEVEQDCRCSCRNIYFSTCILVDGVKKDIRALKKLL